MTVPIRFGEVCLECLHLATSSVWGHCPSCGCPNHDSSFWTEDFPTARQPSRTKRRLPSLSGRWGLFSDSRPPAPRRHSPLSSGWGRLSESSQVTLWAIGLLCAAFIAVVLTW